MLALAVAYEIQCRFTAAVPVMAKGFNHAIQLAISASASAGKLFGLSSGQIANAIAIAAADNISLACVHAEPVSQHHIAAVWPKRLAGVIVRVGRGQEHRGRRYIVNRAKAAQRKEV